MIELDDAVTGYKKDIGILCDAVAKSNEYLSTDWECIYNRWSRLRTWPES
jgi:hypothetical protein